jgi:hypothetical protein
LAKDVADVPLPGPRWLMDRQGMDTTSLSTARSLSDDQVRELALIIHETFGVGLGAPVFADLLLQLLEDVPGFETSTEADEIRCRAWNAYQEIG